MIHRLTEPLAVTHCFPSGTGELAKLIPRVDWSATSLGPLSAWPHHLCTAVNLILQSPVAMILLWGRDGIMIYNDAYARIAGRRHPTILGAMALEEWPEIADFNAHNIQACLAGATLSYKDQALTLMRNGVAEQAWFDLDYSPVFNPDGVPEAVLAVVKETTNRVLTAQQRDKAADELAASNHALKQANSDLEQFAFSASHDLQEPLRMVSVYSQLLKRRLANQLDSESEILLRYCVEGAQRLESLVKGLLQYTRASTEPTVDAIAVHLDEVLDDTLHTLETAIQDSAAVITADPLPTLNIHPVHCQQIFQNLISNAVKYRSKRPLQIHISAHRTTGIWQFSITDNGIGIDKAYSEQIFGLFKRLHGSSEYAGTGLGLAICRRLIDRYGGKIWVDSQLGVGSTFRFTLPLTE